ncbi:tyrosine-type recombinase/integrase [Acuticoccus sediminis]|uniref:tyrosine-type recombinase/integrase n=1 Tax=Acuticoccus sediminis TaxID=2184697 RepID=UPI001CFC8EDF|nr:tyrosine-type recombinase/integrase [Acuticoccus sediminis]
MSVYRAKAKDGKFKSPFWQYDFTVAGRRFCGSTGETTRAAAERVERKLKEEARRPRDDTTINGAFGLWWSEKGQRDAKSATTFWRMEILQDLLTDILERDGQPALLSSIKTKHLTEYATRRRLMPDRRQKLPAPATINRELQILRRIMRYAIEAWDAALALPRFTVAIAAEPDPRVRAIPEKTITALRNALREDYRDVFDWLVMVGARAGNAMATDTGRWLRPDDVDLDARVARWRVKSKTPGGRLIEIPLTTAAVVLLANNLGNHPEAVFTYIAKRTYGGRVRGQRYPITYEGFRKAFKRAAESINQRHLRVHDLRHTAGTNVLRATGNLVLAQTLLGHTTIATTRRYSHATSDDLLAGLEKVQKTRGKA